MHLTTKTKAICQAQCSVPRVLCFLVVMCICQLLSAKETLTVGWEHYPPQQWMDDNGDLQGIDIDIIKAIADKAGYELRFIHMPWKRLINISMKNGDIDIGLDAAKSADRPYLYYSSIPYFPSDSALFINSGDSNKFRHVRRLPDIIGRELTLAVIENFIYSKEYSELYENPEFKNRLVEVKTREQATKLLLAGRVDGILLEQYSYKQLEAQWDISVKIIKHSDLAINEHDSGSFIVYSKASVSRQQADKLNQALEQLQKEGFLDKMREQFLLENSQ